MTIHKSQGQTMTKAELAAGCTFVALSRLKTLSGLLINPMPFQWLKIIANLTNDKRTTQRNSKIYRLIPTCSDYTNTMIILCILYTLQTKGNTCII